MASGAELAYGLLSFAIIALGLVLTVAALRRRRSAGQDPARDDERGAS